MEKKPVKYHYLRKNRANTRAVLRALVALYLAWLGWKVASGALGGDSTVPPGAALLIGGGFILAALVFGLYIWKQYRADLKAAELTPEELAEDEESDPIS